MKIFKIVKEETHLYKYAVFLESKKTNFFLYTNFNSSFRLLEKNIYELFTFEKEKEYKELDDIDYILLKEDYIKKMEEMITKNITSLRWDMITKTRLKKTIEEDIKQNEMVLKLLRKEKEKNEDI